MAGACEEARLVAEAGGRGRVARGGATAGEASRPGGVSM